MTTTIAPISCTAGFKVVTALPLCGARQTMTTKEITTDDATDLTRIEAEFECPDCGGDTFSPTYRVRQCTSCRHRGDAVEFSTAPTAPCSECDDENVRTHVDGAGRGVFTCKACFTRFTN